MKRTPLRRRAKPRKGPDELERMAAFKSAALGPCLPGCERCLVCRNLLGIHWHAHHVVTQQHVRRANGDVWDVRNAMRLCTLCHDLHHNRTRPVPLNTVPVEAMQFADELLGRDGAEAFFARYYSRNRWMGY